MDNIYLTPYELKTILTALKESGLEFTDNSVVYKKIDSLLDANDRAELFNLEVKE